MQPHFFTPAQFRKWLEKNHDRETELLVGFYKKGTGKENMSWTESVEQALCFGWIDGVRRSAGDESYTIRFTPRKANSIWSNVNIAHIERLTKLGLMQPAGIKAYQLRKPEKSGIYAFEKENPGLGPENITLLKKNKTAWEWFNRQTPGYQKTAGNWVESAKQEVTRQKRIADLIAAAEKGEFASHFRWASSKPKK